MPRSICDIEQELQALREDEVGLRKQTNYWMNLLETNPSAGEKLEHVNKLMNNVFDMQKIKIGEIKVLKEMENAAAGRDNQANVKDQSTFHQLLKIVTDPWANLSSSCSTEATRKTLRESVMNFYNLKKNQCMILGKINKKSKHVVTAHIYPKPNPNGLKFFDLNSLDIDNPKNCLRLVKEIEVAFDKKNLTIIEKNGELRIFLLNKTMLSKKITPASPHTFSSIHGSPLIFNNENRPFRRLLALHCYSSFKNAKSKQQEFLLHDDELDNFVFYVKNLLDVSLDEHKRENVKQWLYDNPVGPAAPLAQSQTTQFIYDFIEQHTEKSSDMSIGKLIVEDLGNIVLLDQALFVCNLIINVLKLKPQIAAVVGQLLDSAQKQQIINIDGIANGISSVFEIINGFSDAVWQPLGEIIGTYIGSAQSQSMMNISILTTIMKKVPVQNSKEMIIYIIEYAQKVSSKLKFISLWKLSGLTFDDLLKPDVIDQQFLSAYDWLLNPTSTDDNEIIQQQPTSSLASSSTQVVAASQSPCSSLTNSAYSDADLVKLFRSINEQQVGSNTQKEEINQYIQEKINQYGKYYIVHIVLSYLESCLVVHDTTIDRSVATQRIHILNSIIDHDKEKEIQALYAIQKFIIQLNHPPKMARLLFDVFYDEDCISEKVFFKWLQSPDQEDIDGHNVMIESTKEFFDWLLLAESETAEEDKDDDDDNE